MFKKVLATGAIALFTLTSAVLPASASTATMSVALPAIEEITVIAAESVTGEEALALQFMREEEKVAHDVYVSMYEKWDLPIFNNIAAAEQKHTDAVVTLLERYNVADPASGNALGEFTDLRLQSLYNQLIAQGSKSVADALKVGAAIEEIDILDLDERLAETDNADIQTVYENLRAGSENHLRAFVRNLNIRAGETYVPEHLTQQAYDAIVNATSGRGGGNAGWGGRGGRWQ